LGLDIYQMKRVFLNITTILLLAAISETATADVRLAETIQTLALSRISISRPKTDELTITLHLGDLAKEVVHDSTGDFLKLVMKDESYTQETGKARLPVVRRIVYVPEGSEISVRLIHSTVETVDLKDVAGSLPISPAQPPIPKSSANPNRAFIVNHEFYEKDAIYPENPVHVVGEFQLRNHRGVIVEICPVRYNPKQGIISVSADMEIGIEYTPTAKKSSSVTGIPEFDKIAQEMFLNPPEKASISSDLSLNFLFIVGDKFVSHPDLLRYIEWKKQKGFHVTVKSATELGGTAVSIRNYILSAYQNEEPPAYVLLVGDVGDIPAWTGDQSISETDVDYTQLTEDDYVSDILLGRFSAQTATELTAIIDKSLTYELAQFQTMNWLDKATFISSDDPDYYTISDSTHEFVIDSFMTPNAITSTHIHGFSGGTTGNIISAINSGTSICNYSGHGSATAWGGPTFTISNINSLTNSGMTPFIVSNACLTGSFGTTTCFGESWIRAANKGGFAFLGASNSSYWYEDDWMERQMYDAYFNQKLYSIGAMKLVGLMNVVKNSPDYAEYYFDIYNILGDPSIVPWFGQPRVADVVHEPVFYLGNETFDVQVNVSGTGEPDVLVALFNNETLIGSRHTDLTGTATIPIDIQPDSTGDIWVTITGVDLKTIVDTIEIKLPSIVTIEPDTVVISQTTEIRVRITDSATLKPAPNVEISLTNWEFDSDSIFTQTDTSGLAVFIVTPHFGENIQITGRRNIDQRILFTDSLIVTGGSVFQQPDISASVDSIGLFGSLTTDYQGNISASCDESGIELFIKGCGIDTSVAAKSISVTPRTIGELRVAITKSGYDIYEETILVHKVTAQLSGVVQDSSGNGLQDTRVTGFLLPDSVNAVFDVTTEQSGTFSISSELSVGNYLISAELFGYKLFSKQIFLKCDENLTTIVMQADSGGWLSGKITETGTNLSLDAKVGIDRQSADEWIGYLSIVSDDSTDGNYRVHLPYGDYRLAFSSPRHISRLIFLTVCKPELTFNISLDSTRADILIVDDDTGKRTPDEQKILSGEFYDVKSDVVIAEKSQSASEFSRILMELGYWVVCEKSASSETSAWASYDLVVWTSGSNTIPVSADRYRIALENYSAGGGKLLIEGGEIAWKASTADIFKNFRLNVLHIDKWSKDNAGHLSLMLPAHPVSTMPNSLPNVYNVEYTSFGDQDGCRVLSEAQAIYCGSGMADYAGIIAYDNNEIPIGGQSLFMSVAFDHIGDSLGRKALLENVVSWLISPETLTKGDVNLDGKFDVLDVVRTVNFILNIGNSPKSYESICADVNADSSIDVLDVVRIIRLALGLESLAKPNRIQATQVEMILRGNDLWIQSNGDVSGIQIKLKEPMCGAIELSPAMRESGSLVFRTNAETVLLYDTQGPILSAGETRLCTLTENCTIQSVIVSDLLGNPIQTAIRRLPAQFSVSRNYPNPFNSQTTIRYDLPIDASVEMTIYDIRGHKIRTLENGFKPAGYYQTVWNGKDNTGREVASGIYFFQIISETHRKTMKLMLVK